MPTATSLHIGLNYLDTEAYEGWDGALEACVADATSMEELASELGYDTSTLINEEATDGAVLTAISDAAATLTSGDIFFLTYAGHGGQFADLGGDEDDEKDETWLLYNREILDDEIYEALGNFQPGVRIVVLSDSCHSGTVLRSMVTNILEKSDVKRAYRRLATRVSPRARYRDAGELRLRGAPEKIQKLIFAKQGDRYRAIRRATKARADVDVQASAILISGCQDNQESAEENGHGAFTASLLDVWSGASFTGNYHLFHQEIQAKLPPSQSPNYFTVGPFWADFEGQVPFTIDEPASAASGGNGYQEPTYPEDGGEPAEPEPVEAGQPSVSASSDPVLRTDSAPSFAVDTAGRDYYIFEITSVPSHFDSANEADRDESTWYSTWDDPEAPLRMTGDIYWLPDYAWEALKSADRLWFRIGTTVTEDSWDPYMVSTADDAGEDAPSTEIIDSDERARRRAAAQPKELVPSG